MTSNAAIPKVCKSKIWLWSARVKSDYVDTHGLHFSYQSYNPNIHKATQDKQKFIYAQSLCPSSQWTKAPAQLPGGGIEIPSSVMHTVVLPCKEMSLSFWHVLPIRLHL